MNGSVRHKTAVNLAGGIILFGFMSLTSATPSASPASADITPFTASYKASANGLSASASRSLSLEANNSYRLNNELKTTLLGQEIARLEQSSQFHIDNEQLISDSYSYRLSGIASERRHIDFDWANQQALSEEDDKSWTIPLVDEVYDPLSHQLVLRQQLLHQPTATQNATFDFTVIDGDSIETHRYQLLGHELLATPLGNLNSVKLERVREGSSSRSTTIWLATDWDYLVTRIEQVNGSGLKIKLELESATIGEREVTALP